MENRSKTLKPAPAPNPSKPRTVLTVQAAARELGVSENQILALIEEGRLFAINVGITARNYWRIPVADFEAFKTSAGASPQPARSAAAGILRCARIGR
jgi:excisionase family DNA binding protein